MTGMQASPVSSETNTDTLSDSGLSQRIPKCARCRCHGINCELKGHKEKCQFKDCRCRSCLLVVERQKITATRVAHLRHQRKVDKQRSTGYYSNYAQLTDEEEFVLTRYVDRDDERKRRMFAYDYGDGRPYKIPALRYGGFPDHAAHRQYGNYYPPRAWDFQAKSRLSPCTRECCMPRMERGFPGEPLAKTFYEERHRGRATGDGLLKDHKMEGQLHKEERFYNRHFEAQMMRKEGFYEGWIKQAGTEEAVQRPQQRCGSTYMESIEKESEKEAEIEVDVEAVNPEQEDNKEMMDDNDADTLRVKNEIDNENGENEGKDKDASDLIIKHNNNYNGYKVGAKEARVDLSKEVEDQRRRRDEFLRSKCGEVLSVMFPDFDGKLIKNVAETSGYDIQAAVEYLLDMKKKIREDETKSAFSKYNLKGHTHDDGKKEPCKCCIEQPRFMPYFDTRGAHPEMRQRWAHQGRSERQFAKDEASARQLNV